jgi:hypothetical protein
MEEEKLSTILKASYKPQREAEHDLEKLGYKYDNELSSMDTKVFYDPKNNQSYIAYRGSVRVSDWVDNINLGLGGKSKQLDEAINTAEKTKQKYGTAPTTIGQSRGGIFAEKAGNKVGGKTITYNKGTLPRDVFNHIRDDQVDIRTSKDVVSAPSSFQTGGKKYIIQISPTTSYIDAHSNIDYLNKNNIQYI